MVVVPVRRGTKRSRFASFEAGRLALGLIGDILNACTDIDVALRESRR